MPTYSKGYPEEVIVLRGWDGTGLPQFEENIIRFNGCEKNDMGHETFTLQVDNSKEFKEKQKYKLVKENLMFDCVKTAYKPYDIMVCLSLLRLKHHFPECQISSDGNNNDWEEPIELYKKIFGETVPEIEL